MDKRTFGGAEHNPTRAWEFDSLGRSDDEKSKILHHNGYLADLLQQRSPTNPRAFDDCVDTGTTMQVVEAVLASFVPALDDGASAFYVERKMPGSQSPTT